MEAVAWNLPKSPVPQQQVLDPNNVGEALEATSSDIAVVPAELSAIDRLEDLRTQWVRVAKADQHAVPEQIVAVAPSGHPLRQSIWVRSGHVVNLLSTLIKRAYLLSLSGREK